MLNQVVIVGRIVNELEVRETEKEKKVSNITLAVQRPYKNEKGEYDVDFIDCVLWGTIAENTSEYCKKGDIVGIKGRIGSTRKNEKQNMLEIVAERVTFLSSKKVMDEKNNNIDDYEENISI